MMSELHHVRETLRREESRLRQFQDHEEAVLIDGSSGQVLWRKVGEQLRTEFNTLRPGQRVILAVYCVRE